MYTEKCNRVQTFQCWCMTAARWSSSSRVGTAVKLKSNSSILYGSGSAQCLSAKFGSVTCQETDKMSETHEQSRKKKHRCEKNNYTSIVHCIKYTEYAHTEPMIEPAIISLKL
jgi:hypothetical protein